MACVQDITRLTGKLERYAAAVHAEASSQDPDLTALTTLTDEVGALADRLAAGFDGMDQALELCRELAKRTGTPTPSGRVIQPAPEMEASEAKSAANTALHWRSRTVVQRRQASFLLAVQTLARLSPRGFATGAPTCGPPSIVPVVSEPSRVRPTSQRVGESAATAEPDLLCASRRRALLGRSETASAAA